MEVLQLGNHNINILDLSDVITNESVINNRGTEQLKITITEIPTDIIAEFKGTDIELQLPSKSSQFSFLFEETNISVPATQFYFVAKSGRREAYYFVDEKSVGYSEKGNLFVRSNGENNINESFLTPLFVGAGTGVSLTGYEEHAYLIRTGLKRMDSSGNIVRGNGFALFITYSPIKQKEYYLICTGYEGEFIWESDNYALLESVTWFNESGYYNSLEEGKNMTNPNLNSLEHGMWWVNRTSPRANPYNMVRKIRMGASGITAGTLSAYLALESAIDNSLKKKDEVKGPVIGAIDSGMVGIYATPATKENRMQELARKMWSKELVTTFKNSLFDTQSAIINMSLFPIDFSTAQTTSGEPVMTAEEVPVVLNGVLVGLTEADAIKMNKVVSQFIRVEWVAAAVNGKYKSYLDHNPYTTASLYLPYSGSYDINIDDFINHYMKIVMIIDIYTGDIKYEIYRLLEKEDTLDKGRLLYNFVGNISYNIPITSGNYTEMFTSFISTAAKLV